MSCLQYALEIAAAGFHVFPLRPGTKLPQIDRFPVLATTDPQQIQDWWYQWPQANVGISTTAFNGGAFHLVVADVDNKPGKPGIQTRALWELVEGREFPETYTQLTPTGGQHLVYKTPILCQGKVDLDYKGSGIDSRGKGGYIVGLNSVVEAGMYVGDLRIPVADAPAWLVALCRYEEPAAKPPRPAPAIPVDASAAVAQSREFLLRCPIATAGSRNDAAYKAASRVKDLGVPEPECLELMATVWNVNALPPLSNEELAHVVNSAYEYGQNLTGSAAPEADFDAVGPVAAPPVVTPSNRMTVEEWNKEFAFALSGSNGNVLWFTNNEKGQPDTRAIAVDTFHNLTAGKRVQAGSETKPFSRIWMASARRRTFRGVVFSPGQVIPTDYYNLWHGFAMAPLPKGVVPDDVSQAALDAFLEHIQQNVCRNRKDYAHWLLGFFAHLFQRPWEKPLVAVVFRGEKGVGKDTMVNIIGRLLGSHFMSTAKRRHLTGDFNSHLEKLLLFCLNEAFWSHDTQVQGVLQELITGPRHSIERKGQEPYDVANLMRLIIMGNNDSLIPASWDERRFFCLDVGAGWKQQTKRFESMRLGMEAGGYALLLRYFLEYDLTGVDLNVAPNTAMLLDQKHAQLEPLEQWWHECLQEGRIVGADFSDDWPERIDKEAFRAAVYRYYDQRKIRSRPPEMVSIAKTLIRCCKSVVTTQKRCEGKRHISEYRFPLLAICRKDWDNFIGSQEEWTW